MDDISLCSVLTSAAGAINLSVSQRAGAGVGANVVNTLPYSLTRPSFVYTLIHI